MILIMILGLIVIGFGIWFLSTFVLSFIASLICRYLGVAYTDTKIKIIMAISVFVTYIIFKSL